MDKPSFVDLVSLNFPQWSDARMDDQSVIKQLLCALCEPIEELSHYAKSKTNNLNLTSFNLDEMGPLYTFELPADFEFEMGATDQHVPDYIPPLVYVTISGSLTQISPVIPNTIDEFWYDSAPNRVTVAETVSGESHILYAGILSGYNQSLSLDTDLGVASGQITLVVSGESSIEEEYSIGEIAYSGLNRVAEDSTMKMNFVCPGPNIMPGEFSHIDGIEFKRMYNDDSSILLLSMPFNIEYRKCYYDTYYDVNSRVAKPYFINVSGMNDGSYIEHSTYAVNDLDLLKLGYTERDVFYAAKLIDSNGYSITALDVEVDHLRKHVYYIDSTKLYVAEYPQQTPDFSLLKIKDYDANCILLFERYFAYLNEEITFQVWNRRPISPVNKYRILVDYPDGTQRQITKSGVVTVGDSVYADFEIGRFVDSFYYDFTVDQTGDYLFTLECLYEDQTVSRDQKIISVNTLAPKQEIYLYSLFSSNMIGMAFDSDRNLWILTADGKYHKLVLHRDLALIDYSRLMVFFTEDYRTVEVKYT